MDAPDWIAHSRMRAQRLWGTRLADAGAVVRQLTAMQAQEHRYARWSIAQRMRSAPVASTIDAAFDAGRVLRTHVLRPTWHYVAPQDLRWLIGLSGPRVDAGNGRRYRELGLDGRTLGRANDLIAGAVARAPRTRHELGEILERRGISVDGQRLPHILMHAELTAVICSGSMRSKQHSYAAFDACVPPELGPRGDDALAALTQRYFAARGSATADDFAWWSGLGATQARVGIEMVRSQLSSRTVDDRTYWFAETSIPRATSRVDLVQCYDEVIISYRQSRDVLATRSTAFPVPRHVDGFVHVLLLDGRLLGHWRTVHGRDDPEIDVRIDRTLGRDEKDALGDAIDRYRRFLNP